MRRRARPTRGAIAPRERKKKKKYTGIKEICFYLRENVLYLHYEDYYLQYV